MQSAVWASNWQFIKRRERITALRCGKSVHSDRNAEVTWIVKALKPRARFTPVAIVLYRSPRRTWDERTSFALTASSIVIRRNFMSTRTLPRAIEGWLELLRNPSTVRRRNKIAVSFERLVNRSLGEQSKIRSVERPIMQVRTLIWTQQGGSSC